MTVKKNLSLPGSDGRTILLDAYLADEPVAWVVFAHGIKGFKDWGHWWVLARTFARQGIHFFAFNFSHGGTVEQDPYELTDLEAFSKNTYSKELHDLGQVMDWARQQDEWITPKIKENLFLIGHSRGGPICLAQAVKDDRVAGLITWGAVSSLDYAWPNQDFLDQWKDEGYYAIVNRRTNQEIHIRYALYEDYQANLEQLETALVAPRLQRPYLILHGDSDEAVPVSAAERLAQWTPTSQLSLVPNGDHVFGGRHPWEKDELPTASEELAQRSISFIKENSPIL